MKFGNTLEARRTENKMADYIRIKIDGIVKSTTNLVSADELYRLAGNPSALYGPGGKVEGAPDQLLKVEPDAEYTTKFDLKPAPTDQANSTTAQVQTADGLKSAAQPTTAVNPNPAQPGKPLSESGTVRTESPVKP
jgi:hypothetical protein